MLLAYPMLQAQPLYNAIQMIIYSNSDNAERIKTREKTVFAQIYAIE